MMSGMTVSSFSHDQEDIYQSYTVDTNSFITKPVTFEALCHLIDHIDKR